MLNRTLVKHRSCQSWEDCLFNMVVSLSQTPGTDRGRPRYGPVSVHLASTRHGTTTRGLTSVSLLKSWFVKDRVCAPRRLMKSGKDTLDHPDLVRSPSESRISLWISVSLWPLSSESLTEGLITSSFRDVLDQFILNHWVLLNPFESPLSGRPNFHTPSLTIDG